ncbi:hypothetical protein [Variovorax saccharolyticus]|uniref:hypothetical protein n=1 Tax=Variovorax saccharolyticus TaxID=3053516 RepID=UPI0025778DBF|nr:MULTISPECIES: hypothetical protein [unclassified Variovorax]MDM0022730.1 hypothetical protein [Variovorax sp. J22R187]MDM0028469.1 hypothetical protein [Variovorax sp. J31P216]
MLVTIFIVILASLAIVVWVGALLFPLAMMSGVLAHCSAKERSAKAEEVEALFAKD